MGDEKECMCIGCGTYHLIPGERVKLEYVAELDRKRLRDTICPLCGCEMMYTDDLS